MASTDSVKVAVRIRPQNVREQAASYQVCTVVSKSDAQIFIGSDRSFSYDYVFDRDATQVDVYNSCIKDLVAGVFNGLNATVLAYGQTGSGKTHTMGTAFDASVAQSENIGIIPRAVEQLFETIQTLKQQSNENNISEPTFTIELYNEELIDLLAVDRSANVRIHEDAESGQIVIKNAARVQVGDPNEILNILRNGALNRTTGSTNMNQQSSRSHAIFSIHIKQEKFEPVEGDEKVLTFLTAKLHFVDLAGSERLKRTGATGDRAKEGICINCGLLALGNVICALTVPKKSHVPYRDSKLTRLLQDSLGGNSRTLMIACASPNDVDFAETLNTMTYAARAKAIKNRVTVNKDHGTAIVGQLKAKIAALETELNEYKQGKRMVNSTGEEIFSDQYNENVMLQNELNKLRIRANALQETNTTLSVRLTQIKEELERERLLKLVPKLDAEGNVDPNAQSEFETALSSMISTYVEDNEKLNLHLGEMTAERDEYKKKYLNIKRRQEELGYTNAGMLEGSFTGLEENPVVLSARKEIEDQKKLYEILMEQNSTNLASNQNSEIVEKTDDFVEEMEVDEEEHEGHYDEDDILLAEREQQQARIVMEVANLQDDISTKERLILELEQSERRMAQVRRDYERKLHELSERINATESERDKILLEMSKKSNNKLSEEKVREVKQDYEKRLIALRNDFNKMKSMQSEHERARKRQEAQQLELQRIRRELDDMKRSKVKLVQDMRENAKKVKKTESEVARKMTTLEKNSRLKDNKIRTLQLRDQQREEFMKRKVEQLAALQQQHRNSHTRTPINADNRRRVVPLSVSKKTYSPGIAKTKWKTLERKINACISHHTGFSKLDEQHVRLLNEKVQVEKEATELDIKFANAKTLEERHQIRDDMETNQHHLKYIDEQIADVRRAISDMECSNKENDDNSEIQVSMNTMIQQCNNLYEAHFLLEQLLQYAISKAAMAAQSSSKVQLLEARVTESENENAVNERYITDLINSNRRTHVDNSNITFSILPTDTPKRESTRTLTNVNKIRRRTATSKELLYDRTISEDKHTFVALNQPNKEETFAATTIVEEDENRSTTSPLTESAVTDVVKQYDEYLMASLLHKDRVVSVDATSSTVVTSCKDRVIRCWDLETAKETNRLSENPKTASAVHFVQTNDPSLVLCVFSFTAHLWDTRSNTVTSCLHSSGLIDTNRCGSNRGVPASESNLAPFSFSADARLFCSRYNESYRIWDIRAQKQLIKLDSIGNDQEVKASAIYERPGYYSYLFTGRENGDIQVDTCKPDFLNGHHVESTTLIPSHNSRIVSLFTTDKSLYSVSKNGTLMKFSLVDLTRDFVENNTHAKALSQACLLKNSGAEFDTVCTADTKGNLRVWSSENPNRLQLVYDLENAHGGSINGLCSSTDGILFSCSSDETVKAWRFR